jgi:diguanylate cyclase (GGDEF)-like protein
LFWPGSIQLLIFLGIVAWLLKFANRPNTEDVFHSLAESNYAMKSYNQRYIMESLAREKGRADRSNNPFSICIFDIDRFSKISEKHGSTISDVVLREFSKRVRGELRAMDSINPTGIERTFGRFNQEEFVTILPHTGLAGAHRCAERIRDIVADTPFDDKHTLTISAGVAVYRRGETISDLLSRTEQGLRLAILDGGNRIHGHAPGRSEPAQVFELHTLKN